MGAPSYKDLKDKVEALDLEVLALKEEKEALDARAKASKAAEELAVERLENAERAALDRVEDGEEKEPDPEREAIRVRNTTKNRMEIRGVVILAACEATVTAEQMSDDRIFNRIKRACETGVLKEVQ